MCGTTVKSPTPKEPEVKDPIYMRNPYLDGLGISGESRGRNSLRIDPGTRRVTAPIPRPSPAPTPYRPVYAPQRGSRPDLTIGGGGNAGGRSYVV